MCLHQVGHHALIARDHCVNVFAQHFHDIGNLFAQRALVDGGDFAVADNYSPID